jgi:hypothetical protein
VRAEVIRLACERPSDREVPLARWSSIELAREVVARGICEQISGVTVWRWLSEDAIKPWRYRAWIFPRDPAFTAKAGRILDLYSGRWEGERLHPGDYVVCCDEKPSIQARRRKHARLFDRCDDKDGIIPFDKLVAQFMTVEPYSNARRVFVIVDPDPRPHPRPRQLAEPSRNLLLDRATQSPHPQRLPRPLHARTAATRVRTPLRTDRRPVPMEVHPPRPRPRRLPTRPTRQQSSLTYEYVGELPSQST